MIWKNSVLHIFLLYIFATISLNQIVKADEAFDVLKISCAPQIHSMTIKAGIVWNVEFDENNLARLRKNGVYIDKDIKKMKGNPVICDLGFGQKITISGYSINLNGSEIYVFQSEGGMIRNLVDTVVDVNSYVVPGLVGVRTDVNDCVLTARTPISPPYEATCSLIQFVDGKKNNGNGTHLIEESK